MYFLTLLILKETVMKIKRINFLLSLGASCAAALVAVPAFGQSTVVVDDNFAADGTASTDAQYFYSSSSNGLEVNPNSIGLVSGTFGPTDTRDLPGRYAYGCW